MGLKAILKSMCLESKTQSRKLRKERGQMEGGFNCQFKHVYLGIKGILLS